MRKTLSGQFSACGIASIRRDFRAPRTAGAGRRPRAPAVPAGDSVRPPAGRPRPRRSPRPVHAPGRMTYPRTPRAADHHTVITALSAPPGRCDRCARARRCECARLATQGPIRLMKSAVTSHRHGITGGRHIPLYGAHKSLRLKENPPTAITVPGGGTNRTPGARRGGTGLTSARGPEASHF